MSDDRPVPAAPTTRDVVGAAASSGSDSGIDVSMDDDEAVPTPKPTPSKPAPSKPVSTRTPEAAPSSARGETRRRSEPRMGETTRRTRAKMTLKIPDDEVSRPSHSGPPSAPASSRAPGPTPSAPPVRTDGPSSSEYSGAILTPMRIITIEPPPVVVGQAHPSIPAAPIPQAPLRASTPPSPAPGTMSTKEDSWTPYQPTVADRAAISGAPPPVSVPRPPRPSYPSTPPGIAPLPPRAPSPSVHPPAPAATAPVAVPSATPSTTSQMAAMPESESRIASSDSMDEIPIVTDEPPPSSGDVEIEPEEVTAERAMPKALSVPSPLLVPAQTSQPASPSPPGAQPALASLAAHGAVTPIASPVAIAPTPSRVSTPPIAPSPPAVPQAPVSQSQLQPSDGSTPAMPVRAPQPVVNIKDLPPMRALAPTEPEGLEVHFEDEEPVSAARSSEPEAEIAPEDLVSVESAPSPSKAGASLASDTPAHAFVPPMTAAAATAVAPAASRLSAVPPSAAKPAAAAKTTPRMIVPTASPLAPPPMTDAPTGRRKARPWWEELFNDDFIRTMAKVTDPQIAKEVDFVEESLAVAKGAMLLDLGCGTGRHAIELTRRGYKVVGFDLSLPMLAKAAEEAQERAQKLNFVQGDMREMTFEDTFDGIYSWNTSFGFFEEDKNQQVIQRVHKALKKGGQFVLEVGNRDFIIRQAPSLAWFEGDGCICMDEMSIDWITSRMKVKRTMMMDDGRTKEIDYSVRIYSLHELGKILHDAGFRVAEVSGRCATPGVFFGNESPRTMILAEKK